MTLVRWDPFKSTIALQDRINRLFDEAFSRTRDEDDLALTAWKPSVDIYETGDAIVLKAELPGVDKDKVSIEIKDNILTLRGERLSDTEVKEESYFRRERYFGNFHRAFTLQDTVDPEKVTAKFKDGILEITIPKPEERKPKQISVKVE